MAAALPLMSSSASSAAIVSSAVHHQQNGTDDESRQESFHCASESASETESGQQVLDVFVDDDDEDDEDDDDVNDNDDRGNSSSTRNRRKTIRSQFRRPTAVATVLISFVGSAVAACLFIVTLIVSDTDNFVTNDLNMSSSPSSSLPSEHCYQSSFDATKLSTPCLFGQAPDVFQLRWPTNYYGNFSMTCVRARAPTQVDRVYNLARWGYYDRNYFIRVLPGKYAQFGTSGSPDVSRVYNWTYASPSLSMSASASTPKAEKNQCSVIMPQPPEMVRCMSDQNLSRNCSNVTSGLSNTYGTVSMSTSYNETYRDPTYGDFTRVGGVTWNATAELFINLGDDNSYLDQNLFVPICTITKADMEQVVLKFPSFGELSDFGGPPDAPSLGLLYELGNSYIESNPLWNATMAQSEQIMICENQV